jgi:hypothetical protein
MALVYSTSPSIYFWKTEGKFCEVDGECLIGAHGYAGSDASPVAEHGLRVLKLVLAGGGTGVWYTTQPIFD